jgi:hypothetical protein
VEIGFRTPRARAGACSRAWAWSAAIALALLLLGRRHRPDRAAVTRPRPQIWSASPRWSEGDLHTLDRRHAADEFGRIGWPSIDQARSCMR